MEKENWLKLGGLIAILIIAFVFIPTKSFAVEGTCSWHGGVNCSAMADWDGSAVCNDGWRDSSEIYSQMEECKVNRHYCTQTEASQINLKYDTAGKAKIASDLGDQLQGLNNQATALQIEALQIPNKMQESVKGQGVTVGGLAPLIASELRKNQIQQGIIATQVLSVKSALRGALGDYWNSRNQADRECYSLGDAEFSKSQADFYKQFQSLYIQNNQTKETQLSQPSEPASLPVETPKNPDEICRLNKNDQNAWYNTDKNDCVICSSGLQRIPNTNKCVSTNNPVEKPKNNPPIIKKVQIKTSVATPTASTTLQDTTTPRQEVKSIQKPRTIWSKLTSPIKNLWNRIF